MMVIPIWMSALLRDVGRSVMVVRRQLWATRTPLSQKKHRLMTTSAPGGGLTQNDATATDEDRELDVDAEE